MEKSVFEVVTVHKVTDTATSSVYDLDLTLKVNGEEERFEHYVSTPDDSIGANPAIRIWMKQHPDFPVQSYVPPTTEQIRASLPLLTTRQFRLGLVNRGFNPEQVTAAIEAMQEGAEKEVAKIEWEYATTFNRMHPLIVTVAAVLGLSNEQTDAMWSASADL
ncbi:hypothetical protein GOA63_11605 [Sinorhizobium meliloti]|uniref:hypothetical protein n=1 Tax=Rhizobium meliloti TaxID=382 RepID=UPI001297CD8F|nr:hypothetical protein [Sinorhizobium meliloti]MDW9592862.1 hypothetical protein [Sinorhizobium meliloti]MDX0187629.1 hypothetical protein [Sinorhizobium meliloti]MQV09174.1 hypothetical protein [Sinorhizobium meliloti]MQV63344.1 hypothetical protein [Sinorhizobium meliloti]